MTNVLVTGGSGFVTNGKGIFGVFIETQNMRPSREYLVSLYQDEKMSLSDIGKKHNVTHGAVLKWFKSLDIPRRSIKHSVSDEFNKHKGNQYGRHHTVQSDFFKHWNANMAWLLGFICADGCIENSGTLSACQKEIEPLQYMLALLNSNASVETKKQNGWSENCIYRVRVHCREIIQDLSKLGIHGRKSLTLNLPEIPNQYFGDFLRGYFDGDGSIYHIKSNPKNPKISFIGSPDFINQLESELHKRGCSKRKIDTYHSQSPKVVYGSKQDVIIIGSLMYQDPNNVSLLRKKNIYTEWVTKCNARS